ncbi:MULTISPECIES: hypothetical protein [Hymenobacter]|uniref:Type 1 periplasmic binding fold superfamily protein n=2 Tax=Hymenobacter TaxID=89966 RepID=A0ABS6WZH7_9BACT|nr:MULTISPECIES: hypothetical protein [Hymenobacter]MBO3270237.1 hypothetical protein [Hymenobacter defluvii]MBW3128839.1 hypothetical protein [Hymenobacter profundi]
MKTSLFRPFAAALLLATPMFFASCSDDSDPEPEDDNEFITTIRYKLTPTSGTGQAVTAEWKDLDGAGGAAPTITGLALAPNTSYTGTISFLDETKTPADDITEEVREENYEHLVIYTPNPATGLMNITRTDKDKNNLEVGLTTNVQTGTTNSGNLTIQLRHQPGTKNGTAAPGSDDANVTFPVTLR